MLDVGRRGHRVFKSGMMLDMAARFKDLSDHVEHMREMAECGLFVCGCDECDRERESATEERGGIAPEPIVVGRAAFVNATFSARR